MRKKRVSPVVDIVLAALLALGLCAPAYACDCSWIDTTGEAVVANITPEEARQAALGKARIKAVETISGVNVQGSSIVKDFTLVADFMKAMTAGYVTEEKVLGWETKSFQEKPDSPPVTLYRVNLKSCVAVSKPGDPFFKVKGELNRQVFISGEEARIKATCTKDCFLTILNLTADDKINVLLPNKFEPSVCAKAGSCYFFPAQGLAIEMGTLPGHKRDTEAFYVIATKEKLSLSGIVKKDGTVPAKDLYDVLLSLPPETRAEDVLLYEVREK